MYKLPKFFEQELMRETKLSRLERPKKEERVKEKKQKVRKAKPPKEKINEE